MRGPDDLARAGEKPVSAEHIIPFSFGGHVVLPNASCQTCGDITGATEGRCCAMMFRALRIHHDIPTRNPKKRPTTLKILDGESPLGAIERPVPIEHAPGIVVLPVFPPPAILLGGVPSNRINLLRAMGWDTSGDGVDRSRRLKEEMGFSGALATAEIPVGDFMRVLAKIAHAYVASQIGSTGVSPLLAAIIRKESDLMSYYVGGTGDGSPIPVVVPNPTSTHATHNIAPIAVTIDGMGYIAVQIRLFEFLNPLPPAYMVIVGEWTIPDDQPHFAIVT